MHAAGSAGGGEPGQEFDLSDIVLGATSGGVDHIQTDPGDARVNRHLDRPRSRMPGPEQIVVVTVGVCRIPRAHQFLGRSGLALAVVQRPAACAVTLLRATRTRRSEEFVPVAFRHPPNLSVSTLGWPPPQTYLYSFDTQHLSCKEID